MNNSNYIDVEDFKVYEKLCRFHIDACDLMHKWPQEERYELGSQSRSFSNSVSAQLAEKNESLPQGWSISTEHAY